MRSSNNFLTSSLFWFLVPMFVILYITTIFLTENINKQLDILETKVHESTVLIEDIKKQIHTYENENNRLKDMVSSQKKIIKESPNQSSTAHVDKKPDTNTYLLARLLESESGNQSFEGKLAVGTVVMNRVESDEFPDTIRDVIFQKRQFSVVSNGRINNKPSAESLKAAKAIINGKRVLDADVLYFYNPKLTSKKNWITSRDIEKVIGDHAFAV